MVNILKNLLHQKDEVTILFLVDDEVVILANEDTGLNSSTKNPTRHSFCSIKEECSRIKYYNFEKMALFTSFFFFSNFHLSIYLGSEKIQSNPSSGWIQPKFNHIWSNN